MLDRRKFLAGVAAGMTTALLPALPKLPLIHTGNPAPHPYQMGIDFGEHDRTVIAVGRQFGKTMHLKHLIELQGGSFVEGETITGSLSRASGIVLPKY